MPHDMTLAQTADRFGFALSQLRVMRKPRKCSEMLRTLTVVSEKADRFGFALCRIPECKNPQEIEEILSGHVRRSGFVTTA